MDVNFQLPAEVWMNIILHLDYKDLTRLSQVNKFLHNLTGNDSVWRRLHQEYWQEQCFRSDERSCKQRFAEVFSIYGKYITCYSTIKKAWDQIITYICENCPDLMESIKDPATEEQLDHIEEKIEHQLPNDMRCSLLFHNGQRLISPGLMGSVVMTNHYYSEVLLDIETAVAGIQFRDGLRDCLPVTYCVNTGQSQYIPLSDTDGHPRYQMFYPRESQLLGPPVMDFFVSGNNFTNWLTTYADKLTRNEFCVMFGQPSKFQHEDDWQLTEGFVTIKLETCFLPQQSTINPPNFCHAYRVQFLMSEHAPSSETLSMTSSTWKVVFHDREVTSAESNLRGSRPQLSPGSSFSYINSINLDTTYGTLVGQVHFLNQRTGETHTMQCPRTCLRCLPYMTGEERVTRKLARLQRERPPPPNKHIKLQFAPSIHSSFSSS